uniref:Uncharacterized protein n=1 Tax=Coccidioides posadasii RMSCC 3488 TaxID=454284 RepID=A0A0J6FC69_COCPO|nr:hypothetical protein CPAG_06917 [Coccidioides posadasii RMSCC 3488]
MSLGIRYSPTAISSSGSELSGLAGSWLARREGSLPDGDARPLQLTRSRRLSSRDSQPSHPRQRRVDLQQTKDRFASNHDPSRSPFPEARSLAGPLPDLAVECPGRFSPRP